MSQRYADLVERVAQERLAEEVFRYLSQGSGDGISAGEAQQAWDRLRFVPRVLRDVTQVEVSTTLLGTEVSSPFAVAPTTLQRAVHPEGERAMAQGARDSGSLVVVSSNAGTKFADVGATGAPWWLQVYVTADRSATEPVVQAAVDAGARALVLTADTPVVARKDVGARPVWDLVEPDWLRANFPAGDEGSPALQKATDLGPGDIDWLAGRFGLPVVVKGVLHPADARRCVDAGAAAVWVSNHGGRQLDPAVDTATALADVAAEVSGETEVYVDGGLRRGRHCLAALALGARAAFVGRPALYALADGGAGGVTRLLTELREELVEALRLAGLATLAEVTPDLLHRP